MKTNTNLAGMLAMAEAIQNPAWDLIKTVPQDDLMGRGRSDFTPANFGYDRDDMANTFVSYRDRITGRFTWAIPAPESLAFIIGILDGRPVVEVGAGTGYWAWMLTQLGIDVNAYDPAPVGHPNSWFNVERLEKRLGKQEDKDLSPLQNFYPVHLGDAKVVGLPENHDRVLFLCWPTMDSWAYDAARHFQGDTIIYIGEGPGGCTADSAFFQFMGESSECYCYPTCTCPPAVQPKFEEIATGPLVQWGGLHDFITVYQRKDQS